LTAMRTAILPARSLPRGVLILVRGCWRWM